MSAKILVVDDEPDFVEFVAFNLRKHGYEVLPSSNGLDALHQARRFLPDLVLLDVMMEGIDGFAVCEILRRQPSTRTLPIVMLSAAGGQLSRINCLASGANDFLAKPISPRELVSCVRILLEKQHEAQEVEKQESEIEGTDAARRPPPL